MKKLFLFAFVTASVLFTACGSSSTKSDSETTTETEVVAVEHNENDEHALLAVGGSCDMCTDRIENLVSDIEGVSIASYDLESRELHLHFDPNKTNIDDISKALAEAGHDTDLYKADDEVYNALPGCCHYRTL